MPVFRAGGKNCTNEHKETSNMNGQNDIQGILEAIERYAEAGRKASRAIGESAFTPDATMSWVDGGKIVTVPIAALYDVLEKTGEEEVSYTVEQVSLAGDVAFVRIASTFGKLASFHDLFTLARGADGWRIASKIYSVKA
jgi:hypothetical protein